MKTMTKKALLIVAATFISSCLLSQSYGSINLGYTSNKLGMYEKKMQIDRTQLSTHGITIGASYAAFVTNWLALDFGLNYTFAFNKDTIVSALSQTLDRKTAFHTLDIPLRLMISLPLSSNFRLFGYVGPRLAYTLDGKQQMFFNGKELGKSLDFYEDLNPDLSKFNVYLGPGAGIKYKNFVLKGGYDWGLNNLNKNKTTKDNIIRFQNLWYLSLAYAF